MRDLVVAELFALLHLQFLKGALLLFCRQFRIGLNAWASYTVSPAITNVTLVVHIVACARLNLGDGLMLFTIEALGLLFATNESLVHAEEALGLAESSIMRRPKLVVRAVRARALSTLALRLVELGEVDIDEESLVALFNNCLLIHVIFMIEFFIVSSHMFRVGAVDHELLRNAVRLDDDVVDEDFAVRDGELVPTLALIPREFNEVGCDSLSSNDNESTVIANLVDVHAHADSAPIEATVARHEKSLLRVVRGQLGAEVAGAKNNTDGLLA